MRGLSRAALWVVFGVVVAVALSVGAFAVANGSIGEPAGPVSVAPQGAGKATETDHPTPTLRPTPSAEPTKDGQHPGHASSSVTTSTATSTSTWTSTSTSSGTSTSQPSSPSSSHEDHGGSHEDD